MAVILKITDEDDNLEVHPADENGIIEIWIGKESDFQSWASVSIDKEEAKAIVNYLNNEIELMDD